MTAQFQFACAKVCLHVRPLDGTMQLYEWRDGFPVERVWFTWAFLSCRIQHFVTLTKGQTLGLGAFIFPCANMCSAFILPQVKSSSKVSDPSIAHG